MTMTLEKIKGMNIPVGAPIEMTLKKFSWPSYSVIGYFQGIDFETKFVLYDEQVKRLEFQKHSISRAVISEIEDIKILEYKK